MFAKISNCSLLLAISFTIGFSPISSNAQSNSMECKHEWRYVLKFNRLKGEYERDWDYVLECYPTNSAPSSGKKPYPNTSRRARPPQNMPITGDPVMDDVLRRPPVLPLLRSNQISGLIDSNSIGRVSYYPFTANQGEISIELTVEPGKRVKYGEFSSNSVSFRLFDREGKVVLDNGVTASDQMSSYVAKAKINQRQTMTLGVEIPSNSFLKNNAVGGRYRIQIGGTLELPQDTTGDPVMDDVLRKPFVPMKPKENN